MSLEPQVAEPSAASAVSRRTKFAWSFGGFFDKLAYDGTSTLVQQVYVAALGLAPTLFSLVFSLPRFIDLALDPLLGHWSDNTQTRWGRRKPWMFAGSVVAAVAVIVVWHPPHAAGQAGMAIFLGGCLALLYSAGYSSYVISHNALGCELSSDYNERTHLFKWRMWASAAAGLATPWLPRLCLALEGDQAEVLKGAQGVKVVGTLLGVAILAAGMIPVLFSPDGVTPRHQPKVRWWDAVRMTLSNRPFWLLVISNAITRAGMMITGVCFYYVIAYHLGNGSLRTGTFWWGLFVNAINLSMFLAMGPMALLAERVGKKSALIFGLAASAAVYASVWWTMTPTLPWLCLLTAVSTGVFTNTLPMIKNSMLADVCDLDELNTGYRREAFYNAVFVTSDKLAMAGSLACQGLVLAWSAFDSKLTLQAPETIHRWLVAIVATQPLGFLVGIVAIALYPLTAERCREIRAALELRGAASRLPSS